MDGRDQGQTVRTGAGDIVVLYNPASGRGARAATERRLRAAVAPHADRIELRPLSRDRPLAEVARDAAAEGFATVAAAGGDGTVSGLAAGLVGGPARLGIVPTGTFNYFARGLGLPLDPQEAVALLLDGPVRRISVGEVNGLIFLNNASLGLYPEVLRQRERIYDRFGRSRLAAHWSVLRTLLRFSGPLSMQVTVDGMRRRTRAPMAFVGLSAFQLRRFGLDGAQCIRAGELALFLAPDGGRAALTRLALRLALGRVRAGRDVELFCGREILIETRRTRRTLARDGERDKVAGPFMFRMHDAALQVIAPAGDAP
jgi:diacylglycerol kinase family enzyme